MDMWPNKFVATYTVTLAADALKTEFTVTNTDAKAWDFTAALHSYWSVSDIDTVKVSSPAFNGATFLDKMQSPPADVKSSSDVITFKVTFPHFPISLPHISPHLSSLRPAHTFPHARPLELSACQTETDSVYAGVSGDVVLADSKKSLTIQNSMHTHTHTHTHTHSLPALDTKSAPLFELPACVEPPPSMHCYRASCAASAHLASSRRHLSPIHRPCLRVLSLCIALGWSDTVLWSPYGSEAMGYKNFVCVESAQAATSVSLGPGEYWTGAMNVVP